MSLLNLLSTGTNDVANLWWHALYRCVISTVIYLPTPPRTKFFIMKITSGLSFSNTVPHTSSFITPDDIFHAVFHYKIWNLSYCTFVRSGVVAAHLRYHVKRCPCQVKNHAKPHWQRLLIKRFHISAHHQFISSPNSHGTFTVANMLSINNTLMFYCCSLCHNSRQAT